MNLLISRSLSRSSRPLFCRTAPTGNCSQRSLHRRLFAATVSRIARLTAGSRARSAGSSKCPDLRMCATTRWSGRPGMASCGEELRTKTAVVRRGRANGRPRACAKESIAEGFVCASWCARRCASGLPRKAFLSFLASAGDGRPKSGFKSHFSAFKMNDVRSNTS